MHKCLIMIDISLYNYSCIVMTELMKCYNVIVEALRAGGIKIPVASGIFDLVFSQIYSHHNFNSNF